MMAIGSIMCFGSSSKDDPDAKKSKEIEKQLREDQKRLAKEVKLLLLGKHTHTYTHTHSFTHRAPSGRHAAPALIGAYIGAGESGKSTVLKQMRLIHTKGFSKEERKQWKVTIFQNLLHAFQVVFGAMEEQDVEFAEESNIVCWDTLGTPSPREDCE